MLARQMEGVPRPAVLILSGLVLASWLFLLAGAGLGTGGLAMSTWRFPPPMDLPPAGGAWDTAHALDMFLMWWLMMIAMMLPGITGPVRRHSSGSAAVLAFLAGYGVVWAIFSVAATAAQYALEQAGLLHPMMMWSLDAGLSCGLLLAAGLYQMSGPKARSLQRCRAGTSWPAPFRAGVIRGFRCLAGSAPLMSLLFVGGIMNLYWIAALTLINLLENSLQNPRPLSVSVGISCLAAAAVPVI